jgi:quercetin dioxygenase-like cupin family protein
MKQLLNALASSALITLLAAAPHAAMAADPAKQPTNLITITSRNTAVMPWQAAPMPQIGSQIFVKMLEQDADTGMRVQLVRYPAGHTTSWHTHPCAHGIYVLEGTLKTHQGEFGPGIWVWFPEGGWMEHGATALNDVTFLFITNKAFGIDFLGAPQPAYPPFK